MFEMSEFYSTYPLELKATSQSSLWEVSRGSAEHVSIIFRGYTVTSMCKVQN
jgi:hypothetical protein